MRIAIYILLVICAVLMFVCYSLCVIAHEADERAERMYRKWAEEHSERADEIVNNLKADVISANKILVNERTMKGADDE